MMIQNDKTKLLLIVCAIILGVGIVGGGVYYYFTDRQMKIMEQEALFDESPPVLELGSAGSTLRGMTFETGFSTFTQSDIDNFNTNKPASAVVKDSKSRVNYFFVEDAEMTVSDIIKKLHPVTIGNQLLFAYYSPGESAQGKDKCYYIYPRANVPFDSSFKWTPPNSSTSVCLIQNPDTFKVSPNRGFAIIMKRDFQYYGLKNAKEYAGSFNLQAADNESGWYMIAMPDLKQLGTTDTAALKTTLSPYQNRIIKLFVQNDANQFAEVDLNNYQIDPGKWAFFWAKLDVKPIPAS